jgi:hypothetical protein
VRFSANCNTVTIASCPGEIPGRPRIANASMNAPSAKTSPNSSRTRMASVGVRNAALATAAVCSGIPASACGRIDITTHLTRNAGPAATLRVILIGQCGQVTDHNRRAGK